MAILVTGGAGYIGSHTVVELLGIGKEVVVVDNLCNSSEKSLERVKEITGKDIKFYKADILDRAALEEIFENENIESCIHFAGLKAVGESVAKPWEYYNNNITGTLVLLDVMKKYGCKNIIFSSLFFFEISVVIMIAINATTAQPATGIQSAPRSPPVKSVPKKKVTKPTV